MSPEKPRLEVVQANVGFLLRFAQRGQDQKRQNRDDADDDRQLDCSIEVKPSFSQRHARMETAASFTFFPHT